MSSRLCHWEPFFVGIGIKKYLSNQKSNIYRIKKHIFTESIKNIRCAMKSLAILSRVGGRSSGPLVLWSAGPLVLWSAGPPGPLVHWSASPLVLWSFVDSTKSALHPRHPRLPRNQYFKVNSPVQNFLTKQICLLYLSLSIYLSICLSIYLSMYLSIHLSFYLSICSSTSTKYYTCHEICTSRSTKSCACHQICTPRATKSCTCHQLYTSTSKSPAPATKSALQGPQSPAPATNSTLPHPHQKLLRLPRNLHSKATKHDYHYDTAAIIVLLLLLRLLLFGIYFFESVNIFYWCV